MFDCLTFGSLFVVEHIFHEILSDRNCLLKTWKLEKYNIYMPADVQSWAHEIFDEDGVCGKQEQKAVSGSARY